MEPEVRNTVTVTCVLGYCGSGKSWHADRLLQEGQAERKFDENFFSRDYPGQPTELVRELLAGNDCVVVEGQLCLKHEQARFVAWLRERVPNADVKWLCIEKDLEKANGNCRNRTSKADPEWHVRRNHELERLYFIPEGAEVVPMWPYDG